MELGTNLKPFFVQIMNSDDGSEVSQILPCFAENKEGAVAMANKTLGPELEPNQEILVWEDTIGKNKADLSEDMRQKIEETIRREQQKG